MKKGWQKTARLGDLFMTAAGGTPLTTKREYYEGGTIPWLNSGEVRQGVVHSARTFITELGLRNSNAKIFPKDTVLVALYGATAAQVGILAIEAATNQAVFGIYPNSSFLPKFIFYFLLSCHQELSDQAVGSAQPNLSGLKVKDLQVPLAPLPEQQRIVGVLDEAFASLATAQAHAAQNLQNARALFESHLNAVFTQRGVGWKQTTLGEEIDLLSGFAFKSSQYTTNEKDIRLLRGDNIIQGCLRWDDVKRWPANDTKEYRRYWLSEGDVVLAMDRPWVKAGMKYAMMTSNDLPCLLVQRTARLRGGENLDNRFLKRLIGSAAFTSHILGVQTGIGVPHISGQQIKDFGFSCPSLAEQRRIADNLDALAAETQRLTRIYEQKLAALAALKKSLLQQAFSGEI
jgi:type I restriction enzyme S subunit